MQTGNEKNGVGSAKGSVRSGHDSEKSTALSTNAARTDGSEEPEWLAQIQHERTRAKDEADRELEKLDREANHLLAAPKVPEFATAATKWETARAVALGSPILEAWGADGQACVNGTYKYMPEKGNTQGPPCFQQQKDGHKWLYVEMAGNWIVGGDESMDVRRPQRQEGLARSKRVEPGVLPHLGEGWETCGKDGGWAPSPTLRFWLSESIAVEWQRVRVLVSQTPVISVEGADERADGLFDFVDMGTPGAPPVFQHQRHKNYWMYLAASQEWWISDKYDMDGKHDHGLMRSSCVQPGTHPSEVSKWYVNTSKAGWKRKDITVTSADGAIRAVDWWAHARGRAEAVQLWGLESHRDDYIPTELQGPPSEPPVYQSRTDKEKWLYLATDGCWWTGSTTSKDQRAPRGYLVSPSVKPGTLPQDVDRWYQPTDDWQVKRGVSILLPRTVAARWRESQAAAAARPVVKLQNVAGPDVNGLYDYSESETQPDGAPVFQHQINQDQWLYVATDGCWWLSNPCSMRQRAPSGMVYSTPVLPGVLPTAEGLGWIVLEPGSKAWKTQAAVCVR